MHGAASLSQATCWAVVLWAAATAAPAHCAPISTRQTSFQIPFHVDPPRDESQRPVEVQLYVSLDRGASWRLHSRVAPQRKQFAFRAEQDGEYWFLVRTKDVTGRILPDKAASPELQVIVDTALPTLQLTAVRGSAGEIVVQWSTSDPHLQPQNLKIDFQTTGAVDLWQALALDPTRVQTSGDRCSGETIVWPKQSGEPLTIRAEVLDRAGNRAVAQTQVAAATPATPPAVATVTPPPAATPATVASSTHSALAAEVKPAAPPAAVAPQTAVTPPPFAAPPPSPLASSSPLPAATRWPADQATDTPLTRATTTPPPAALRSTIPYVVQRLPRPSDAAIGPTPPTYTPPPRGLAGSSSQESTSPTHGTAGSSDATIQPPLAEVRRDGGAAATDRPAMTRSTCRLTRIDRGRGERGGEIDIYWEAWASAPAPRPVSLLYSDQPTGPWLPIALSLMNNGRYVWQFDNRVPERVYLRLEMRDQAGHVEITQTTQPLVLDEPRP